MNPNTQPFKPVNSFLVSSDVLTVELLNIEVFYIDLCNYCRTISFTSQIEVQVKANGNDGRFCVFYYAETAD
jgi:hypothetical protein